MWTRNEVQITQIAIPSEDEDDPSENHPIQSENHRIESERRVVTKLGCRVVAERGHLRALQLALDRADIPSALPDTSAGTSDQITTSTAPTDAKESSVNSDVDDSEE